MENIDVKSLDSFMMNLIEFGSYGDVKRYVESLFDMHKRTWRDNLPDISEIKPNKIKSFDVIIQTVYFKFITIDIAHNCLVNALDNVMRGYLKDEDLNSRIKRIGEEYEIEKIELLKKLKYMKR